MSAEDLLHEGVQMAFAWFGLGLLLTFAFGVLLGFVDFVRRFLG